MTTWPVAGASVALLIAAAKAHGRQLRVERELQGHAHVVIGGSNDPWAEALWERDRTRFWTFAPAASLGLALAAGWRWPGEGLVLATAMALLGPVCAFVAAGLLSAGRFARASHAPHAAEARRLDPKRAARQPRVVGPRRGRRARGGRLPRRLNQPQSSIQVTRCTS